MKKTAVIFSAVATVAALSACSKSGDSSQLVPKLHEQQVSCEIFRKNLPSNFKSGWVTTNERPGDPTSPQIKVFYYYRAPLKGRVTLFLNGGPGGSSHSSERVMEKTLKDFGLQDQISFVYMDQRGTGCSDEYPEEATEQETFGRGKWYGTRGIVADAEAIRTELGLQTWSIFGQSYGAMIVHRYATLAPQSLDRALAYANTVTPDRQMRQTNRIESQFAVWDAYYAKYPNDRASIQLLLASLPANLCYKDTCGQDLVSDLVSFLGFIDEWPKLSAWVYLMTSDGKFHVDQVQKFNDAMESPSYRGRNFVLRAVNFWDRDVLPSNAPVCSTIRADWLSKNPTRPFESEVTECSAAIQLDWSSASYNRVANYFHGQHDELTFSALRNVLSTRPKNFFLLYSGDLDPYVPARSFGEEVQALGDVLTYRNFPDAGHEGFYTRREVFQDFLAP